MTLRYLNSISFFLLLLLSLNGSGQVTHPSLFKEHCATEDESELYNLISEYRRIHNLPAIPFSRSLSYLARVHATDLSANRPDFGGCNPHSWSVKGAWKPFCYARDPNRVQLMNEKPKEITGYKGKGWEMVYSSGEEARATEAFDLWISLDVTKDYLLNTGKWLKPWKAIGIGFFGEYACVWFGDTDDPEKGFGLCGAVTEDDSRNSSSAREEKAKSATEGAEGLLNKFYLITGSLNSQENAEQEAERLRKAGYPQTRVVASGNVFRVSLMEFNSESDAQTALNNLRNKFNGAWILKPGD
jgi:hypothetical protein